MLRSLRLLYPLRDIIYAWSVNRQGVTGESAQDLLPESYLYVRQFNELAQQRNVSSLVVLLPRRLDDFDGVKRQMHEDGIEVADLVSLGKEFTREQFRASPFDIHPSVAVHRRTGEALADMFSDIGCEQTAFRARPRLVFGPQLRLQRCEVVINGRSRLLAVDWAAN